MGLKPMHAEIAMPRHSNLLAALLLSASFCFAGGAEAAAAKTVTMTSITPDGLGAEIGTIALEESDQGLVLITFT
jgi:hypothetical protein